MSPARSDTPQSVIVVTGLAGAGKSTALKALEDIGYEAVDNLPLSLLPRLLRTGDARETPRPLALGVDSRTRAFSADAFLEEIAALRRRSDLNVVLLFLDCSEETLSSRFSETRRRHPLAPDRPVRDGIAREREIMASVKREADLVLDTTDHTVHDLKRRLAERYRIEGAGELALTVMSFGFAHGLPRDADLVFDVRFLRNPNFVPDLKPLDGRDERVARHVAGDSTFPDFYARLEDLLVHLLPLYQAEGKSYLTVACGCTGGRHRSVFIVEKLGKSLEDRGYHANIVHRDLDYGRQRED